MRLQMKLTLGFIVTGILACLVVVMLAYPTSGELSASDMRQMLLTGVAVAVAASIVLGVVMGKSLSGPVRDLLQAIRTMREQEELYELEVIADGEVGRLTEAYNDLSRKLAQAHAEIRELAILDPLTNLYNRRYFDEQAGQVYESATRYEQPLSVMIGSLDHFKKINAASREIGDLVLEKVASIIEETTRKSDVAARYGDGEFVVLFANTQRSNAAVSCENVRAAIEGYAWSEFHPDLSVTMSMGLSDDTQLGSVSGMISQASQFLAEAQARGENQVVRKSD